MNQGKDSAENTISWKYLTKANQLLDTASEKDFQR